MLRGHDPNMIPGVWTELFEDSKGLFNSGQLFIGEEGTQLGKETHMLLKYKAIQHESIGFDLPRDKKGDVQISAYEKDNITGWTHLKEIELWEISLVAFPANVNARVTRVKDILRKAATEREFEQALRESGLSKTNAQYIVSLIKPSLRDAGNTDRKNLDEGGDVNLILNALKNVTSNI
jgi:HK97 family phage prohead protease